MPDADLARHALICGRSGAGKSTLIQNVAIQLARKGRGFCIVDPHKELIDGLLDRLPRNRLNDVILFDVEDEEYPIGFNPLAHDEPDRHRIVSQLVDLFHNVWDTGFLDRAQDVFANAVNALMDIDQATLLWVDQMLTNDRLREWVAGRVSDPIVRKFWTENYPEINKNFRQEIVQPVLNKVRRLITSSSFRNIVGQVSNGFDMVDVVQNNRILLVNVSRAKFGPDKARFFASLLIEKIFWTSLTHGANDFTLFIDEAGTIVSPVLKNMYSESRKFGLSLLSSIQYLRQFDEKVRDAAISNMKTLICFQLGATNAEELALEFKPEFTPQDLVNLKPHHIRLKLSVNGVTTRPFSAVTLPPHARDGHEGRRERIIQNSRQRYARRKTDVEGKINRWLKNLHPNLYSK